jgi:hypothetical protein
LCAACFPAACAMSTNHMDSCILLSVCGAMLFPLSHVPTFKIKDGTLTSFLVQSVAVGLPHRSYIIGKDQVDVIVNWDTIQLLCIRRATGYAFRHSACLPLCLFVCLSVRPPVRLSACLSVAGPCLSVSSI